MFQTKTFDFEAGDSEKESLSTANYPYILQVSKMLDRYPNLRRFHETMVSDIGKHATKNSRVAVVEIQETSIVQKEFDSPLDLRQYLQGEESSSFDPACKIRLYLFEGLAPDYVEAIGSHFRMDPYVFAEQLLKGGTREGDTAMLPSRRDPERYFTLQYVEAREFGDEMDDLGARCMYQNRKIWAMRINSKFDGVGHIHRIASYWSRQADDGNFDAVMLLDPPVGDDIKIGKGGTKTSKKCPSKLYHGGYNDFTPFSTVNSIAGPTRSCAYDDIRFYWSQADKFPHLHAGIMRGAVAEGTSFFLKKIVASNWMPLITYFDLVIDRLEYALARSNVEGLSGAAKHWSDVEFWHRRCAKSCDHLEESLFGLGGSFLKMDMSFPGRQEIARGMVGGCEEDFLYIYSQMMMLKKRSQRLGASLTNLIGIIESKRAFDETQSIKMLTILGMLFVPLAFTSGLFSMSGNYSPGETMFWVYWATSIPLVVLVFLVAFARPALHMLRLWPGKRRIKKYLEAGYANQKKDIGPPLTPVQTLKTRLSFRPNAKPPRKSNTY